MIDDGAPEDRDRPSERDELEGNAAGALVEDASAVDDDRHYLHDPNGLLETARDEDERDEDDLLVLDQTELEELGLVLDDPHQPEPE